MAKRAKSTSPEHTALHARVLLAILALATVSYGYFHMPAAWNETSRFNLVRSIVELGRLDIDAYHRNTGDKALRGGHYYSDKAPGASLLAVPSYFLYYHYLRLAGRSLPQQEDPPTATAPVRINRAFLAGMFISSFFSVGIVSVLGLLFFFTSALRLAPEGSTALLATLSLGLGSLAFPYATLFYGHQLCGALLCIAFSLLLWQRLEDSFRRGRTALAGLAAGYAVVTEYPALIAALVLLGYLLLGARERRVRAGLWFLLGALPPALLLGAYNTLCFGAPWATGYDHVADPTFAAGMSEGLHGLSYPRPLVLLRILFGGYRGLFFLSPVLALGVVGAVRWYRQGARLEALTAGLVVGYFLLLNASYYLWWGGSALGPRHAIPMLPFLALPLALLPPGRIRRLAWPLLAYSVVTMLVATAVGPEPPEHVSPAIAFHWGHLLAGRVAVNHGSSNLGLRLGLPGLASLLPLVACWIGIGLGLHRLGRRPGS